MKNGKLLLEFAIDKAFGIASRNKNSIWDMKEKNL